MNYVKEYLKAINDGSEVVPDTIKAVYEREVSMMGGGGHGFVFDEDAGLRPIEFVERFCKHSAGRWAGRPLKLELFQKAKIQLVYGWKEADTGFRRFREVGDIRGRKCGKSTETAGIQWYALTADGEGGPEIYCVANKLEQAKVIFKEVVNMRTQSPSLKAITKKRQSDVYFSRNMGFIKAIASDTKTMDGLNAHFFSLDEWHELRDRNLYDVMVQSQTARDQPLAWLISTMGFYRDGFCDSQVAYYRDIAMGNIENYRVLPLIYELNNREDWTNPKMWAMANPGLGRIKKYDTLADHVQKAKDDPEFLPTVLTKDFNVQATKATTWLPFEAIVNETVVSMDALKNSYAIGGCDLSATTDLTCASLLLRKREDPHIYVLQHYFIPEGRIKALDKVSSKEAPYRKWAEQGHLTICQGAQVDYSDVTSWFERMVSENNIRPLWVCYDRALAGYWVPEMEKAGFTMERTPQGPYTWSQPMKEMGAAFTDHLVVYQNNPVLRWCMTNTGKKSLNKDGIETIQPVKIAQNKRIDGTVSLLNAWVGYTKHFDEYMSYVVNTKM